MTNRRSGWITAIALLVLLGFPSITVADGSGRGRLFVPGDHFDPGATLEIRGSEFDPGARLILRLSSGSNDAELGRATVAEDRTFTATATVPSAFPRGYAELTATDTAGTTWSTFVLIGDRPEGPDAQEPVDERTIWLAILAAGLVVMVIALIAYRRANGQSTSAS